MLLSRSAGVATSASLSVCHARDQRLDEARRGQQRIALEVDHQIRLVKLRQRFGATLGPVAAFGRGHDHADAETGAGVSDPLIVGDDEHAAHPGHPPRRLDAALDQGLGGTRMRP